MKIIGTNALIAALFLCSSLAALLVVTTYSASIATNSEAPFTYTIPPDYSATVVTTAAKRVARERKTDIARVIVPQASAQTFTETKPTVEAKPVAQETDSHERTQTTSYVSTQIDPVTEVKAEPKLQTTAAIAPAPANTYEARVVTEVRRLTNAERSKKGLPTLTPDNRLTQTAQVKVDSMADLDYFAHTDPHGCDFTCLLQDSGYKALAWGENLMQYRATKQPSAKKLAAETVTNWLKSSGHRENILNATYTHEGIAVIKTGDTYYVASHYTLPK